VYLLVSVKTAFLEPGNVPGVFKNFLAWFVNFLLKSYFISLAVKFYEIDRELHKTSYG